jgi:hypothetical protein
MTVLYLLDADRTSVAYPVVGRVVPVGRDPTNRIVLTDRSVSRFQFLLCRTGSDYLIQDAGSRYGTYLNRRRLTGPVVLRRGSWIEAGDVHLLYWDSPEGPLSDVDSLVGKLAPPAKARACPAAAPSWRERSFRFRIWWRLSPRSLGFGWNIRRR